MKELKIVAHDFCELFANCLCIVTLIVGGFLILINMYHYREVTYKYYSNIVEDQTYISNKAKIATLKTKASKSASNDNLYEKSLYDILRLNFQDCLSSLEQSKYFNIDKNYFNYKDIYDYNGEIYSTLSYKCLFEPVYNIEKAEENKKVNVNFPYAEKIKSDKNIIANYADYLRGQILSNSNYYYYSDNSRNTLYNQTSSYFGLNYANYNLLFEDVELMINWYSNKVGR